MASEGVEYWKNLAEEYKQQYEDAKEELEEYQASSQELETEMEMQLEQSDKKIKDLQTQNERLQTELDTLRDRVEEQHSTDIKLINELQDELAQLRAYKEELEKYIRELEQSNDDLERAKRETVASLQDFEAKLNQAIERNAFLESELDDKDYLMESVQRLKDEARDLRQELDVTKKKKDDGPEATPSHQPAVGKVKPEVKVEPSVPVIDYSKDGVVPETPNRNNKIPVMNGTPGAPPLTPSARISALNIVGDLLRKVGALETKLNAVKNAVKDQSPMNKPRTALPSGIPSYSGLHSSSRRMGGTRRSTTNPAASSQQGFVKISV